MALLEAAAMLRLAQDCMLKGQVSHSFVVHNGLHWNLAPSVAQRTNVMVMVIVPKPDLSTRLTSLGLTVGQVRTFRCNGCGQ